VRQHDGKETGLGGFGGTAGAVCLGSLPGDAVTVGSGFGSQVECVRGEGLMPSSA